MQKVWEVEENDNLMECKDKARYAIVKGVSVEPLWEEDLVAR